MTPPEDQTTEAGVPVASRRRDRRQLLGVLVIVLVLCAVIGVVVAKTVFQPNPKPVVTAGLPQPPAKSAEAGLAPAVAPNPSGTPPATQTTAVQATAAGAQGTAPPPTGPGALPTPGSAQSDEPAVNIEERDPVPTKDRGQFLDHMAKWRHEDPKFLAQRWERYLSCQDNGDLTHDNVRQAFLATPRERFCREQNLSQAYAQGPHGYLPIGYGVTITGPNAVARMTDRLDPDASDRCLEIGTGSGYQSAILANVSNHVYTIEIIEPLYKETKAIYEKLIEEGYEEYQNVHLKSGDGYYGWKEHAPYNKIIVTCAIDHIPPPLLQQLAPNGIMVIPIGPPTAQRVLRVTKHVDADGKVSLVRDDLYPGGHASRFVPFTTPDGGTHFKG